MGLVDLHCHLLPEVDDGSSSMATSLKLAQEAVADGVSHLLYVDEDGHYLLLEMPSGGVPTFARQLVFELLQHGVTPVIVHPERNAAILDDPSILEAFLEQGCLTQLTASYMGTFGKKIEDLTTRLIEAGQGTIFASDAHALARRDYELNEGLAKMAREFDPRLAEHYRRNAKRLINGELVRMKWQPLKKKRRFWLF